MKHYKGQNIWNGLEFPLTIQKIGKFSKNNTSISVSVLFNIKKSIQTACRSDIIRKCSKQVNLLLIVDWETRDYTAIKTICRFLSNLNGKNNHRYQFSMSRLNGFCTASAIGKHYKYCNGLVKSSEQKNWLKFHNGKAHFKLPFIVYANFEIILKLVDK